jgi:hypothetical protein
LLVTAEGLYSEANSLELSAHLVEFLDVSPRPDEILGHDFAGILRCAVGTREKEDSGAKNTDHLPRFCAPLDVAYKFLFAGLEFCAFAVELALRLCKRPLVLAETLCGGDGAAEEGFLGRSESGRGGERGGLAMMFMGNRQGA